MCNGEASIKEYVMAKHRLKDGKITWKRWGKINKPKDKTSAKRMCNGEALTKEYAMAKHRLKECAMAKHR